MKKGEKSSGSNSDWKELADEINKYTSILGNSCSDSSSKDGTDDNDNNNDHKLETMTQSLCTCVTFELNALLDLSWRAATKSFCMLVPELSLKVLGKSTW